MRLDATGQRRRGMPMTDLRPSRWNVWRAYAREHPDAVAWTSVAFLILAAIPMVYWVAFASPRPGPLEFQTGTLLSRDKPRNGITPIRDRWRIRLDGDGEVIVAHDRSFSTDFAVGETLCVRQTITGHGAASVHRYYVMNAGSCPP